MTKICKKCGKEKELSEFHIDREKKFGVKNICKECLSKKLSHKKEFKQLIKSINNSIYKALKYNSVFSWGKILGYSKDDLKHKLEEEFTDDMNWENYGRYWIVKKIFKSEHYISQREICKIFDLKNLIPIKKGKKINLTTDLLDKQKLYDILPSGKIIIK